MDDDKKFYTRKEVRKRTGWSLTFIDRRLPRTKLGGKVLIPAATVERVLNGESSDV